MKTNLVMLVGAVLLSGCMAVVQGNGTRKEELRSVGEFAGIDIGHGFHATAAVGSPTSVRVEADENLLSYVRTRVEGGRLIVDAPDGTYLGSWRPVLVTIVSPTLTSLGASGGAQVSATPGVTQELSANASGGSRLVVNQASSDRVFAQASGGSRLEVSGVVRESTLNLSGGSVAAAAELRAQEVRVNGSGGSSGTIRASESVTGSLSGGSTLTVFGRPPVVRVDVSGGASVHHEE